MTRRRREKKKPRRIIFISPYTSIADITDNTTAVLQEVSSTLLRDEYFKPGAAVALLRQYFKKAHWVGALNGSLIFEKHKVVYPLDTVTPVKESPSSDKLLSLGSLFAVAALQEQYEGFATASLLESLMAKKLDTEHLSELMEYLSKKAKQVPVPRPSALKADTLSGSFSANQKSNNGAERSVEAADAEVRSQGDNSASGSDETVVVEKKKRKKRRKRKKSTQNEPLADPPEMAQPTRLAHPEKSAELTSLAPENGQEEPRRAPGKKRLIELKEKFASDQSQLEVASTWEAICSQQSRVMRLEAERSTTNMERDSKEAFIDVTWTETKKLGSLASGLPGVPQRSFRWRGIAPAALEEVESFPAAVGAEEGGEETQWRRVTRGLACSLMAWRALALFQTYVVFGVESSANTTCLAAFALTFGIEVAHGMDSSPAPRRRRLSISWASKVNEAPAPLEVPKPLLPVQTQETGVR
eukprot:g32910.t1